MKATYDEQGDSLWIRWNEQLIEESDEVVPGIVLDYDKDGNVVGVEVVNASKKIKRTSGESLPITLLDKIQQ
ncbi:MAG: DUF2283 domain-containing protein [Nodosilinea sp.]